jgi:hypothetical protein
VRATSGCAAVATAGAPANKAALRLSISTVGCPLWIESASWRPQAAVVRAFGKRGRGGSISGILDTVHRTRQVSGACIRNRLCGCALSEQESSRTLGFSHRLAALLPGSDGCCREMPFVVSPGHRPLYFGTCPSLRQGRRVPQPLGDDVLPRIAPACPAGRLLSTPRLRAGTGMRARQLAAHPRPRRASALHLRRLQIAGLHARAWVRVPDR